MTFDARRFREVMGHFATGPTVVPQSLAWVECGLGAAYEAGDHELVIGKVRGVSTGQGTPLLFYRSRLARLTG